MTRLTDIKRLLQAGPELHLPRRGGGSTHEGGRRRPSTESPKEGGKLARLRGAEVSLPRMSRKAATGGLVGVEIEADSIAVVEIRGGAEVSKTAVAPLPPGAFADGEILDPAAVTATLKSLWSEHGLSKQVRLGVANERVVTRTMQLPRIDDPGQLAKAVRFQAEDQIPMPLDQAVLDYRVVGGSSGEEGGQETIEVVVSAARREMIGAALKPLRDAGLDPVGVDLSAFALIRALGDPLQRPDGEAPGIPDLATVLYCNVGETSNLAIAQGRICRFTRVSPAGLESVVTGLCEKTGMSPEHTRLWMTHVGLGRPIGAIEGDPAAVEATREALERGASALLDDLRLTIDFYGAQEAAAPVDRVVIGGPGGFIPGLADQLSVGLGLPIVAGLPPALASLDPVTAARLTLSYGLALEE
jgi:type IV pilus assembly protein PilM